MKTPCNVQCINFVDGSGGKGPLNWGEEIRLARTVFPELSIKECFLAYPT